MAGHSHSKNIMYRKGAQDSKRARTFAKIAREIVVAARAGSEDPAFNPRLRTALLSARVANMPKDNVERALKKAKNDASSELLEELRYEGYGIGGIAIIVEAMTDNRNRTASDVRSIFAKFGGVLGETGSVSFLFEHIGWFCFDPTKITFDALFEVALDVGASHVEEAESPGEVHLVTCPSSFFAQVRDGLFKRIGDPLEEKMVWNPITCVEATHDSIAKMIDALEDHDDVQHVYSNRS